VCRLAEPDSYRVAAIQQGARMEICKNRILQINTFHMKKDKAIDTIKGLQKEFELDELLEKLKS
jgi:hypothetical protein